MYHLVYQLFVSVCRLAPDTVSRGMTVSRQIVICLAVWSLWYVCEACRDYSAYEGAANAPTAVTIDLMTDL